MASKPVYFKTEKDLYRKDKIIVSMLAKVSVAGSFLLATANAITVLEHGSMASPTLNLA